jgi:hypothetical protein
MVAKSASGHHRLRTGESLAAMPLRHSYRRSRWRQKKTVRGRKQDRAGAAGGQDYEVRYDSNKTERPASAVKKAVKKVGNARKRVEKGLRR